MESIMYEIFIYIYRVIIYTEDPMELKEVME